MVAAASKGLKSSGRIRESTNDLRRSSWLRCSAVKVLGDTDKVWGSSSSGDISGNVSGGGGGNGGDGGNDEDVAALRNE
eukprot:CAMPEP_0171737924 /NCGR_PEP_ID=MMETSP0991-20121206/33240_1 /TAXON_ID=483369 /ORGANISM="non described non described, Strain CCMP2098" /LENGTH=78 /DNA_ID=CAMNT_0012335069 /DNA_START=307 /DNA_END=543 /DNA_ORIENTATION=+